MGTIMQLKPELCTGCTACRHSCPQSAITMQVDGEGFLRPIIREEACVDCGLCAGVCPVLEQTDLSHSPVAYAVMNKDAAVRAESSSGGLFTLLAETVLERGGVVFGAAFDDALDVVHTVVKSKEELAKLRGSKYVQSRLGHSFQQVKEYLDNGTPVFFSGTPCQVEGLHRYLRKPYDHLITQDMICHGVPSPMAWRKYVQGQEKKYGAKIGDVSFRYKLPSWRRYSLRMQFSNGKTYTATRSQDPFMRSFLQDLTLRPSCYRCAFKKVSRVSDVTLADFWGIQDCLPDLDDDRGTSLVICHTEKAGALFESIKDRILFAPADLQKAIGHNRAMCYPAPLPPAREAFMDDIRHKPFKKAVDQYCRKPSLLLRAVRKLKRLVRGA